MTNGIKCAYHGWLWGLDGVLKDAQDPEDFPQGNPCGRLRLKELRCDTWGGFVWYTMSDDAPPLLDFLARGFAVETKSAGPEGPAVVGRK